MISKNILVVVLSGVLLTSGSAAFAAKVEYPTHHKVLHYQKAVYHPSQSSVHKTVLIPLCTTRSLYTTRRPPRRRRRSKADRLAFLALPRGGWGDPARLFVSGCATFQSGNALYGKPNALRPDSSDYPSAVGTLRPLVAVMGHKLAIKSRGFPHIDTFPIQAIKRGSCRMGLERLEVGDLTHSLGPR